MLHDVHRQHLMAILKNNGESHYEEIISLLIVLTDNEVLDPAMWFDVVNAHLPAEVKRLTCQMSMEDLKSACRTFASSQLVDVETVENIQALFKAHFSKERRSVGLHGLYSKYRIYTLPVAAYNGLLCGSYIAASSQAVGATYEWILALFEPWIVPLMEDQRQETAAWIQQFAEANKVLFPWAPGDAKEAEVMMSVFSSCVRLLEELSTPTTAERSCLSYLLETYCQRFARPAIKDFVLHIVHLHWLVRITSYTAFVLLIWLCHFYFSMGIGVGVLTDRFISIASYIGSSLGKIDAADGRYEPTGYSFRRLYSTLPRISRKGLLPFTLEKSATVGRDLKGQRLLSHSHCGQVVCRAASTSIWNLDEAPFSRCSRGHVEVGWDKRLQQPHVSRLFSVVSLLFMAKLNRATFPSATKKKGRERNCE